MTALPGILLIKHLILVHNPVVTLEWSQTVPLSGKSLHDSTYLDLNPRVMVLEFTQGHARISS